MKIRETIERECCQPQDLEATVSLGDVPLYMCRHCYSKWYRVRDDINGWHWAPVEVKND